MAIVLRGKPPASPRKLSKTDGEKTKLDLTVFKSRRKNGRATVGISLLTDKRTPESTVIFFRSKVI